MKNLYIIVVIAIISLFTIQSAMADQLVINDSGGSITIDVDNDAACMNGARNISNLNQHSNLSLIRSFYRISFYCIKKNGNITVSGNFYQLAVSPSGTMCMTWNNCSGYQFDIDKCV